MLISLSEEWLPRGQKLRGIIKARRKIHLEVDGILAASAVLSTLIFSIFLIPVAVNASILDHFRSCYMELVLNIISTVALFIVGCPSLYYFPQNISTLRKGRKQFQTKTKDEVQEIFENDGSPEMKFLTKHIFFKKLFTLKIMPDRIHQVGLTR